MRTLPLLLLFPLALTLGCADRFNRIGDARAATTAARSGGAAPAPLSDEFDDPATLSQWRHAYKAEGWGADQLERFDIARTRPGWMYLRPYTSVWYQDYRGVLAYKPLTGDFVMTTRLRVSDRAGSGPPRSQFSLAGIMIRAPRADTARTWRPGGENYVFLSLGAADTPGTFQFEVKTTVDSDSKLEMSRAPSGEARLRVARIGDALLLLRDEGSGWTVHRRYHRPDFPDRVQAGITCYTDWPNANRLPPQQHNGTVIRGGSPDLVAQVDYVRYRRPRVPAALSGRRLADPGAVTDAELLSFLGAAADEGR